MFHSLDYSSYMELTKEDVIRLLESLNFFTYQKNNDAIVDILNWINDSFPESEARNEIHRLIQDIAKYCGKSTEQSKTKFDSTKAHLLELAQKL